MDSEPTEVHANSGAVANKSLSTIPEKHPIECTGWHWDRRVKELQLANGIDVLLQRLKHSIMFADSRLKRMLCITRGAQFDIDEDDPEDTERRFFLPGPVDKMELALQMSDWSFPTEHPDDPVKIPASDACNSELSIFSDDMMDCADKRGAYFNHVSGQTRTWKRPVCEELFTAMTELYTRNGWTRKDGRTEWTQFDSGEWYIWPQKQDSCMSHEHIPHVLGTVHESTIPRDGAILRSELLVIAQLFKLRTINWARYQEHSFYPVLIVSFYGRFNARIIQAYLHNDGVFVRTSRLLDLNTSKVTPEVKLVLRWMNCRPTGETLCQPVSVPNEELAGLKLEDQPWGQIGGVAGNEEL